MDHLLILLKNASDFQEGAAKEMIITIANMLAPNDPLLSNSIRQRLGSFLNQ